jgi:hypothetical protein
MSIARRNGLNYSRPLDNFDIIDTETADLTDLAVLRRRLLSSGQGASWTAAIF